MMDTSVFMAISATKLKHSPNCAGEDMGFDTMPSKVSGTTQNLDGGLVREVWHVNKHFFNPCRKGTEVSKTPKQRPNPNG